MLYYHHRLQRNGNEIGETENLIKGIKENSCLHYFDLLKPISFLIKYSDAGSRSSFKVSQILRKPGLQENVFKLNETNEFIL